MEPVRARVQNYQGRPTIFVDGQPLAPAAYSPVAGRRLALFYQQTQRFLDDGLDTFFLTLPNAKSEDFFATPFWDGDRIEDHPLLPPVSDLDEQAAFILKANPGAYLIVRYGCQEPKSWRDLHPEELFVNEAGTAFKCPSLASEKYNQAAAQYVAAVVRWCEKRPWAHRIIGYWPGHRMEGTHEPLASGWLVDHGPVMATAWQEFLRDKYGSEPELWSWYGPLARFGAVPLPAEKLRRPLPEVAELHYWQDRAENASLRDYLELGGQLWDRRFRLLASAMDRQLKSLSRERIVIWDALKQPMQGWSNEGFFNRGTSWPVIYPDTGAGSGQLNVAPQLSVPGCDGLITPHDYGARGIGGVYEPEGAADSCVLRQRLFLCEMDTRSWTGTDINFPARNLQEWEAVTWRNLACGWSRGFSSYYMDVYQDWFAAQEMHSIIRRQAPAMRAAVHWPHQEVPGIAVILDDQCALETNGSGHVLHEHVMWEWRGGLAHCGVPYRTYLLQDLELPNFPEHRVFYFPNMYRVDDYRLDLLRRRVFGRDRVVLWGPGSGISDGRTLGPQNAALLTGFHFEALNVNEPRRVQITDFSHPITANLDADCIYGSPTSYGPVLFPLGGRELGRALSKGGADHSGLRIQTLGGPSGDWHSVFTTAAPLPATLWRALARFAGAHIWSNSNDVLYANANLVSLHSVKSERKEIRLPTKRRVRDLVKNQDFGVTDRISWRLNAPETRVFVLTAP